LCDGIALLVHRLLNPAEGGDSGVYDAISGGVDIAGTV